MRNKMQTAVIVCLSLIVVILTIGMTIITRWYLTLCSQYEEGRTYIDELTADNKLLLEDKRDLIRQNDEMLSDNQKLTAAVKEMREIIKKLTEPVQEEPELQVSESNESVFSSQSENVLQTDATNLKERLPEGHTNVISGMPLTSITNKQSEQWKLQCDTNTFTGEYGIRCYNDKERTYYLSAMGSAYGRTIGDTFRVTLKCGTVMYVMLGEFKDDGTDPNFFGHITVNYDKEPAICILEFIYDPKLIDKRVLGERGSGNFCVLECFGGLYGDGGNIEKIEYLGRKWEP